MKQTIMIMAMMLAAALSNAQTPKTQLSHHDPAANPARQAASAKPNYQYKLNSIISNDNVEASFYHYDASHRLISVFESVIGEYEVDDSLYYNNQGQMVRLSGFQHLGNEWKNVYYVDYTYDPQGNIATRTNYNNINGTFQLGGTYHYTYNAQNQITLTELDLGGTIFQKIEYAYNNGLLATETWYSYSPYGLQPDEQFIYQYADGRLTDIYNNASEDGSSWTVSTHETFSYDSYGNCTEYHKYNSFNNEVDRKLYDYDLSRTLAQTLMPWHPELTRPKSYTNTNTIMIEHWYSVDVDMVLQYVCDYIYSYSGIDEAGISPASQTSLKAYPNPAATKLNIEIEPTQNATAELLDLSGRQLKSQKVDGSHAQMDVSTIAPGIYLLRVTAAGQTTTRRVIVK